MNPLASTAAKVLIPVFAAVSTNGCAAFKGDRPWTDEPRFSPTECREDARENPSHEGTAEGLFDCEEKNWEQYLKDFMIILPAGPVR